MKSWHTLYIRYRLYILAEQRLILRRGFWKSAHTVLTLSAAHTCQFNVPLMNQLNMVTNAGSCVW